MYTSFLPILPRYGEKCIRSFCSVHAFFTSRFINSIDTGHLLPLCLSWQQFIQLLIISLEFAQLRLRTASWLPFISALWGSLVNGKRQQTLLNSSPDDCNVAPFARRVERCTRAVVPCVDNSARRQESAHNIFVSWLCRGKVGRVCPPWVLTLCVWMRLVYISSLKWTLPFLVRPRSAPL